MTSVRDGGVGSAGSLGPGMYDSGRYHAYIQRHVASPYLSKPPEADKARRSGGIGSGSGANGEGYDDDNLESGVRLCLSMLSYYWSYPRNYDSVRFHLTGLSESHNLSLKHTARLNPFLVQH